MAIHYHDDKERLATEAMYATQLSRTGAYGQDGDLRLAHRPARWRARDSVFNEHLVVPPTALDPQVALCRRALMSLLTTNGEAAENLRSEVIEACSPDTMLTTALDLFDEEGAFEILAIAASLIEDYGRSAVPALRRAAALDGPESEPFVGIIGRTSFLDESARGQLLSRLAGNPDADVGERLLEVVMECAPAMRTEILGIAARNQNPETAEEARRLLATSEE